MLRGIPGNDGVKLAVADVDAGHMSGAARQQDMGKAAGGGADVQRLFAGRVYGEGVERRRELDAAARNPRIGRAGGQLRGKGQGSDGLATTRPSSVTSPASIASRALARLANKPRSTRAISARLVSVTPS